MASVSIRRVLTQTPADEPPDDLITWTQAEAETGVNVWTLRRVVRECGVRRWKIPGDREIRLSRAELQAALIAKPR